MGKKIRVKIDDTGHMKITEYETTVLHERQLAFEKPNERLQKIGCVEKISLPNDVELCKSRENRLFTVLQLFNRENNKVDTDIINQNFNVDDPENIKSYFLSESLFENVDSIKDIKMDISPKFIAKLKAKKE